MSIDPQKGALPLQRIRELLRASAIENAREEHLQPSSIDLSLSDEAHRMRGTFLPQKGESMRDIVKRGTLFPASLAQPLELCGIYLVRLNEKMRLPPGVYGCANNKSSSGRVNLQTRLLGDGVSQFDKIPPGYTGELWLEIIPKSFPVKLEAGERLNQIRLFTGDTRLSMDEHRADHAAEGFLYGADGERIGGPSLIGNDGIAMTIDLSSQDVIGYKCSPTTCRVLDFSARNLDPLEFFEPIPRPRDGQIFMRRDEFYIFVTKEWLRVPIPYAVEMIPYDPSYGEFRSHYAGFFDPGWGYGPDGSMKGTPAVLEVFTHDNDFILRDGQPICKVVYERLTEPPEIAYGDPRMGSHYLGQKGPRLGKQFRME
ncbi:2'-deoxycytidine 5'-triphosphate deaminase [Candidatus Uhrbacteria bacterium]|nr:2'-deoxycytidine 5'-triphosphate deaminase [Candidatus Uhrbacteria bacterium]